MKQIKILQQEEKNLDDQIKQTQELLEKLFKDKEQLIKINGKLKVMFYHLK